MDFVIPIYATLFNVKQIKLIEADAQNIWFAFVVFVGKKGNNELLNLPQD